MPNHPQRLLVPPTCHGVVTTKTEALCEGGRRVKTKTEKNNPLTKGNKNMEKTSNNMTKDIL